jgi:hypothetical protein
MKILSLNLLTILLCQFVFAQGNDLAIQAYKDAEEAFSNGKYETAISNLGIAETMLKTTNSKIQGLKLKSYKQLALADSINNFIAYSAYVTELNTKKSELANDAAFELSNFSKDKALFLENKKNSLINPIENITVGQLFSAIQKPLYGLIDFEKPKEENQLLCYRRKIDVPENQIGIHEIVVDKNSDRIVKVVKIFKTLTLEQLGNLNMGNFFNEKFMKFDPKVISNLTHFEKAGKKEYNVARTTAKIDETTSYFINFYTPTNFKYKDIKNEKSMYFIAEGYEIK